MSVLSDVLDLVFRRTMRVPVPAQATAAAMPRLIEDLLSSKGEITGVMTARHILDRYNVMTDAEKLQFFKHLAEDLDLDHADLETALHALKAKPDRKSYDRFLAAAEPRRQELARRLNRMPGATRLLVDMRADLLRLVTPDDPISRIDSDFRHLFASWFNRGFLEIGRAHV